MFSPKEGLIIEAVFYDWWIDTTPEEGGVNFCSYHEGSNGVAEIKERLPQNGMEIYCVDVLFDDGHVERIFNVNKVVYGVNPDA